MRCEILKFPMSCFSLFSHLLTKTGNFLALMHHNHVPKMHISYEDQRFICVFIIRELSMFYCYSSSGLHDMHKKWPNLLWPRKCFYSRNLTNILEHKLLSSSNMNHIIKTFGFEMLDDDIRLHTSVMSTQ